MPQAVAATAGLPARLGKYELMMPLAAGGMARIYIGRSTGIGSFERHVVLKMITPERANDQVAVNMFLDEARLAASLNHQNVAQVFEVGEEQGVHYLAMEYVHGQDLRALLAKAGSAGTRIPLELALTVVAGAAAGLHHAHERRAADGTPLGIVHRDVSPSNIMIGYDGAVKLLDFGIAKAAARSVETQSGIIKGKFAYMAPEQCRGRDVDRRSDVFSLGIILYEISTQHRCFRADSDFDTMHRIVTGDVVRPTRLVQGYPQALEAIVMKALATDPAQRYQSAGALLEALEAFAVSSRMSLSTMGLGRFMRDMFGEQQEPWLNTAATKVLQPVVHKENTISSTNGERSSHQTIQPPNQPNPHAPEHLEDDDVDGIPDEADDGAFPDSAGILAKTILELPLKHDEPPPAPLAPAPYTRPTPPPGALQMPPGTPVFPQQNTGPMPAHPNTPPHPMPLMAPPSAPVQLPQRRDSTPMPAPFATPGSGTGPAMQQPIVSTKHGYASAAMTRGDASYPSYAMPHDALGDVQLKPNRRPLFIGLGLAIVGIIVILAVSLGGKESDKAVAPPEEEGSAATPTESSEVMPTPPSDPAVDDNMVALVIKSDPPGADVLVAGTKIGTTPFDKKMKRGMKAELTLHLEGYEDFTSKLDLASPYDKTVKLVKIEEVETPTVDEETPPRTPVNANTTKSTDAAKSSDTKSSDTKSTDTKSTTTKSNPTSTKTNTTSTKTNTTKSNTTKSNNTPPKPKCQPPGPNVDPFSGVPVCKS